MGRQILTRVVVLLMMLCVVRADIGLGVMPYAFAEQGSVALESDVPSDLPAPGMLVGVSAEEAPALFLGMTIHPEDPWQFDFIVDQGDQPISEAALRREADRLMRYFLVALAVPEEDLWVNLSPYEEDRVVPEPLAQTAMGRDLLAQDYLLKQLAASLVHPDNDLGEAFWSRVYERAGGVRIPVQTFNKVWILPDRADIYIEGNSVFIADSRLRVMTDEDYLAMDRAVRQADGAAGTVSGDGEARAVGGVTAEVFREIVIPEIEREVNDGAQFGRLRQIYHAMILAAWYKENLRDGFLGQTYADQQKTRGLDTVRPGDNRQIYDRYVQAFRQGVFQLIREEYDASSQAVVPRKYFSGGVSLAKTAGVSSGVSSPAGFMARTGERIARGLVWIFQNRFWAVDAAGDQMALPVSRESGTGTEGLPRTEDRVDREPPSDPGRDEGGVAGRYAVSGAPAGPMMRAEDYPVSPEVARHYQEHLAESFRYQFEHFPAAVQRVLSYDRNYFYLYENSGDLLKNPVAYVMISHGSKKFIDVLGEDFVREHFKDLVEVIKLYRGQELQDFYFTDVPKLVEAYGLDFVQAHWDGLVRMCRAAGAETGFLLKEALPALLSSLEGDSVLAAQKWEGLVDFMEGKGAGANKVFRYYLPHLLRSVPREFVKEHWDDLLVLDSVVDEDRYAYDVLEGLGHLGMNFGWQFVADYWDILYPLGREAGINAGYLYGHGLVRLRPLIFDDALVDEGKPVSDEAIGRNLRKYGRDLIRLAESAGLESRWNLFHDSFDFFWGNFSQVYVRAHWDDFVTMAAAARTQGPFLWRWTLPKFIHAFTQEYFQEKLADIVRICLRGQDEAGRLLARYPELDAEYGDGFVKTHWDGLFSLADSAGPAANALFRSRLVEAVQDPQRLERLANLLAGWSGREDHLITLFSLVQKTAQGGLQKKGFDLDALNVLVRQILERGLPHYVNRLQEVLSENGLESARHARFRAFFVDAEIDLNIRMTAADDYLEIVEMERLISAEQKNAAVPAHVTEAIASIYRSVGDLFEIIQSATTSSKQRKTLKKMRALLNDLRRVFVVHVVRMEATDDRLALFDQAEVKKQILTILSIANTLEHASGFGEKVIARALVQRFLLVLFDHYHPGRGEEALPEARAALRQYINDFSTEQLIDLIAASKGQDRDAVARSLSQHKSNREAREDLIAAGYSPALWTDGLAMDVTVVEGMTADKKRWRILQAAYELVEMARELLNVESLNGEALTPEYYQSLDSYRRAKDFVEAIRLQRGDIPADTDEYLVNILESIKRVEGLPAGEALPPYIFRALVQKDFLREATAGLTVAGCYNPRGVHREVPIVRGAETTVFFVSVLSEAGKEVANAELVAAPEGAYIYASHPDNGSALAAYDLELVFAQVIARLTRWIPRVYLTKISAGYRYLRKVGEASTESVTLRRPATIFTDQYFDSGEISEDGDLTLVLFKPLITTKDDFKAQDGLGFGVDEVVSSPVHDLVDKGGIDLGTRYLRLRTSGSAAFLGMAAGAEFSDHSFAGLVPEILGVVPVGEPAVLFGGAIK